MKKKIVSIIPGCHRETPLHIGALSVYALLPAVFSCSCMFLLFRIPACAGTLSCHRTRLPHPVGACVTKIDCALRNLSSLSSHSIARAAGTPSAAAFCRSYRITCVRYRLKACYRLCRYSFPVSSKSKAFFCRSLYIHLSRLQMERRSDMLPHVFYIGSHLRTLCDYRGIDVADDVQLIKDYSGGRKDEPGGYAV